MVKPMSPDGSPSKPAEGLASPYEAALRRFCLRRGVPAADIDDLIQDVHVRLLRLEDASIVDNGQAYVFQVATNLIKDKARRAATHSEEKHFPFDDRLHSPEQIDPARFAQGRDDIAILRKAILELPPRARQVFVLQRFEDLTYREIAGVLGVSVSAVEKQMMLALRRLSEKLERDQW
jgi:RNA polymerase sigma-70 factor (ECF subfamily)